MQKGIVILSGNHLCHNPRVIKEASTLADVGYEVQVLGAWFDPELKSRDQALLYRASFRFRPVVDFTSNNSARLISRVKSKVARLAHQSLGLESQWQLGPTAAALTKAVKESDADLFVAHSEPALWAIAELLPSDVRRPTSDIRTPQVRVGVDMEDWFSEDLLPEARRHRPVKLLKSLERGALGRGIYSTCTSRAMAEALAKEYGCDLPNVIYNAFPFSDRETIDGRIKDRRDRNIPSIHWYSQTLGFGRGIEDLIAALPFIEHDAEIHFRGKQASGFREWLQARLPADWRHRVFTHELVSSEELLSRIAEHDIGFGGEQRYCKSRDLTVTNKILHYLLAGLAVIASDTAGQCEVADQSKGAILIYRAGDAQDLARQLNYLLSSAGQIAKVKEAALNTAREMFCWERQAPTLLATVAGALKH